MARLGRTIPNRPIIGKPQLIPVAAAMIQRTSYVVRAVDTGRRVRGKATFGIAWKLPTIRPQSYVVKPARTGKAVSRVVYGLAKITTPALPLIARTSYVAKPTRTGRPAARVIYGRAVLPPITGAIRSTGYFVRPADTGRRIRGKATYGRAKITSVALTPISRYSYFVRPVRTSRPQWQVKYGRMISTATPKLYWINYSQMVLGLAQHV